MATISDVSHILSHWTRRWRWQLVITWSLRGFNIGLVLALIIGMVGLYQSSLLRDEFLILVISASLSFLLVAGGITFIRPIQPTWAARHFDLLFHLEERLSTAVEVHQPQKHLIPQDIIQRQLEDTIRASNGIDIKQRLPLAIRTQEILPTLVLLVVFCIVLLRGDDWFRASQLSRDIKEEVIQQQANIEKLIEEINSNQVLSEEQKQLLTTPLQDAMESLKDDPSLENSVSILTLTSEKLQALSNVQSEQVQQALMQAGSQLAQQKNSPLQSVGSELAQGDYISAATQLENIDINNLNNLVVCQT